jgi:hypothetical protein
MTHASEYENRGQILCVSRPAPHSLPHGAGLVGSLVDLLFEGLFKSLNIYCFDFYINFNHSVN